MVFARIIAGMMSFVVIYFLFQMVDPIVNDIESFGITIGLMPSMQNNIGTMKTIFHGAIVVLGGVTLLFIVLAPIKRETEVRYA